jgi:hypothetical protein
LIVTSLSKRCEIWKGEVVFWFCLSIRQRGFFIAC